MARSFLLFAASMFFAACQPAAATGGESQIFRSDFEYWQRYVADVLSEPLRAPDPAQFDSGTALTLEGWFYFTDVRPRAWLIGKGVPINGGAGGVQLIYRLSLDDTGTRILFGSDTFSLLSPNPLTLRRWTHVAAVMDAGTARLYVDGALVGTQANAQPLPAAPTVPLGIGAPYTAAGEAARYSLPGVHAQRLRVWSQARTGAQIMATLGAWPLPPDTPGLVAAWPLDDPRGLSARDVGGQSRNLVRAINVGVSRLDVLEDGPHYNERMNALPAGVLTDTSDSTLIDFDSDGDLDLVVFQVAYPPTSPPSLKRQLAFRNEAGTFVDATAAVLGTLLLTNPRSWHVADFNGDNRDDLFIGATGTDTDPFPGEQSRLLLQSSDGRLVDVTSTHVPIRDSYTHGLGAADIDGDGDIDLLLANYIRDTPRLYVNDGAGRFTDQSGRLPANVTSGPRQHPSAVLCDVNGDGRADAVLGGNYYAPTGASSNTPNVLLMQAPNGQFVHDPQHVLPPKLYEPAGVTPDIACADLDGDSAPELLLSTDIAAQQAGLQLLANDGAGRFTEATARLNLDIPTTDAWYIKIHVLDVDVDTRPDILLRTNSKLYNPYSQSRSVLLNKGGAVFADASEVFIANTNSGIAPGDVDGDGDLDLVLPEGIGGIRIFELVRQYRTAQFVD